MTQQDWYLRSSFIPIPTPTPTPTPNPTPTPSPTPTPGPTPTPSPAPTFVPENLMPIVGLELSVYGSVLPTAMSLDRVTLGTLKERVGDEICLLTNPNPSANRFVNGAWVRAFAQPNKAHYSSLVKPSASGTIAGLQTGLDVYRDQTAAGALNIVGFYLAYANDRPDIDGLITNAETTANINRHAGSLNLHSETAGLYWTHFWHSGAYLDLVTQASYYRGNANAFRTSLSLKGNGINASAEFGYPINLSRKVVFEPEAQLIYQYANFNNSNDLFSPVNLGASNELLGRIGARLKFNNQPCNQWTFQPFLRANLWSTLAGASATAIYGKTKQIDNSITTTARNTWVQLGGGVTVKTTDKVTLYSFVDGLAALNNNHSWYNGYDAGIGLRINI